MQSLKIKENVWYVSVTERGHCGYSAKREGKVKAIIWSWGDRKRPGLGPPYGIKVYLSLIVIEDTDEF